MNKLDKIFLKKRILKLLEELTIKNSKSRNKVYANLDLSKKEIYKRIVADLRLTPCSKIITYEQFQEIINELLDDGKGIEIIIGKKNKILVVLKERDIIEEIGEL